MEEPQERISEQSMDRIVDFIQMLYSNIKSVLEFASKIERVKFKESFKFFLIQCIKFSNITQAGKKGVCFEDNVVYDIDELNDGENVWYEMAKHLSLTIRLLKDNKAIHANIQQFCIKIRDETDKYLDKNYKHLFKSKIKRVVDDSKELKSDKKNSKKANKVSLNASYGMVSEKDLERCSICDLPLIDESYDNKNLYKLNCCDTRCHLYCCLRLVSMRCCKQQRKCQKCLKEMDENEIKRIESLKNMIKREKDYKIVNKDQKQYKKSKKICGDKAARMSLIYFQKEKKQKKTRIVYDLFGHEKDEFVGVSSIWC